MTCRTCRHPQRHQIEQQLLARVGLRHIAAQHGIGTASLRRHLDAHLPRHLAEAWQIEQQSQATDLLVTVRELLIREREAETAGDTARDKALATPGAPAVRLGLIALDCGGKARERQGRLLRLLCEVRGVLDSSDKVAVSFDDLPAPPPGPAPDSEEAMALEICRTRALGLAAERCKLPSRGAKYKAVTLELDELLATLRGQEHRP